MHSRTATWLYAAGVGAGAMFLLDPSRGRRRRAEVGRRASQAAQAMTHAARVTGKDIGHRAAGVKARLHAAMQKSDEPSDQVLVARVRSALGRAVSHPGAIGVLAHDGTVTLDGPVLTGEADNVVWALGHVRGVRRVENHLTRHDEAGGIPGLQGRGTAPRLVSAASPSLRTPAARLISASAAMALLVWGARRSRAVSMAAATGGAAMLAGTLVRSHGRHGTHTGETAAGLDATGRRTQASHNGVPTDVRPPDWPESRSTLHAAR